ncbi:MAG: cation:proton antiporter [Anaerolinea sp.]|nr:cation:proton antiporter [Anaerolinea sp.]MCC6973552.1 cation:proton antiporter [Anaerolineae bacterium]CAG0988840.1 Na(+)/H(+) antiporter subunit F [Anaerolineae bacterium]
MNHTWEFVVCMGLSILMIVLCYRLWRGPTTGDRMLALETMGALGVLILIALSVIAERTIYLDLGVLLALFSFLGTLVFARYLERGLIQ